MNRTFALQAVLLLAINSSADNFNATFYPRNGVERSRYNGRVTELFTPSFTSIAKAGFRPIELGVVEVRIAGFGSTISIDPFKYEIREEAARRGGNAFQLADSSIVDKNTKAYMAVSATIYSIERKDVRLNFADDFIFDFEFLEKGLQKEERETAAEYRINKSAYALKRSAIIDQATVQSLNERFSLSISTDSDWKFMEVSSLTEKQRTELESFLGRMIQSMSLGTLVSQYSKEFEPVTRARRIKLLSELAKKYPSDFADFRKDYFEVKSEWPEETVAFKKPAVVTANKK